MSAAQSELVDFDEIAAIELHVRRRMREQSLGEHASALSGLGVDFVGLREWEAGDSPSAVDWAQSSLTGFSPLVIRDYERRGTAPVMVVADRSASTRCGIFGTVIAAGIARAAATIGLSALYAQDPFGLIAFEDGFTGLASIRPKAGRAHLMHCLEAYQGRVAMEDAELRGDLVASIAGQLRRTTMLPVVSDFLFDNMAAVLDCLAELNAQHDVFLVMIDSAFAVELPDLSSGWIAIADVESGQTRIVSRRELLALPSRVRAWQDEVQQQARAANLDVLRIGVDPQQNVPALMEFVAQRTLRKR